MCDKTYQDSCYNHCILFNKCNHHRLHSCDKCGRRIKPGEKLIIVNDRFLACSDNCAEQIKNRPNQNPSWEMMTTIDYSIMGI